MMDTGTTNFLIILTPVIGLIGTVIGAYRK